MSGKHFRASLVFPHGTGFPLPTTFYRAQLAPDGKIYITATNGNKIMHVIHQPDLPGPACAFENNAVFVDNYIFWGSMPYFPNYHLGALQGSICDSLHGGSAPVAGFEWHIVDTISSLTVQFANLSEHATSWSWDFGDGTMSQDSSPVHTYGVDGIYHVCLVAANGFGVDSICHDIQVQTSAVSMPGHDRSLVVYPNPVTDRLYVLITDKNRSGATSLYLFNALQQPVFTTTVTDAVTALDIRSLEPGVYYAVVLDAARWIGSRFFTVVK